MKPNVRNTADKDQVNKARDKVKTKRDREIDDIHFILSHQQGRRFIYRLINDLCHYDADDFNNSGSITFRSLGERNIGRVIKGDCFQASLNNYQLAEKENWKHYKQEN